MLFDKETSYWQEEYRKGNLDDEDMLGETRALLDGTAEREFYRAARFFAWAMIPIAIIVIFSFLQTNTPETYANVKSFLKPCALGTGYDPTGFFFVEVVVAIILFNIRRKIYPKRRSHGTNGKM